MYVFCSQQLIKFLTYYLAKISLRLRLMANLCYFTFTSLTIYVAATAPTFGSQPECNHTVKYVFFFHTVLAISPWLRYLGIIVCASAIIAAIGGTAYWGMSPREIRRRDNNAMNTRETPKVSMWTYYATFNDLIGLS